jgi:F0F1-type ATP synthase assembly protein I
MYARSERPLTEAEHAQLDDLLRRIKEQIADAAFKVILLSLFDVLVLVAVVMVILGEDRSGTVGRIAGAVAALIANLVLLASAFAWADSRAQRRRVLAACADGNVIVEQVEATSAVWVVGPHLQDWFLFAVAENQLLAVPGQQVLAAMPATDHAADTLRLPACFELVSTRAHRLQLATTARGLSTLPFPKQTDLAELVPQADDRRQLSQRLDGAPLFPGRLADLGLALRQLLAPEAVPVAEPGQQRAATWGLIQARIEERFEIDFGPGGLAAELIRLAESTPRLVAGELLEVVRQRLSPGASFTPHRTRPAYLRLREALVAEFALPRQAIRPSARLQDLVPRMGRADSWARLARRLGQPLPPFAEPRMPAAVGLLALAGMALVYVVGVPTVQAIDAWAVAEGVSRSWWFFALGACFVPPCFIAGIGLAILLSMYVLRNRIPYKFQAEYATVGQLARFLAQTGEAASAPVPWTEERQWLSLRAILAAATHRLPSTVARDTDLIDELGLTRPGAG